MATQNIINKTSGGITVTGTANINTTGSAVSSIGTGGTGATNIGNATGNTAVTGSLTASTTLTATSGNITATNGSIEVGATAAASTAQDVDFLKSRSGGVITTGDTLGTITWQGHDGTQYITGAQIVGVTSGTIATNRIPTSLQFYTHPNSTTAATLVATLAPGGGLEIATPTSGGNAGILIDGGGITVTAGGATITAGGLTVSAGGAAITGNSTLNGNLTLQAATDGIYTTDITGNPTLLHTYGSTSGYNVFCGQGAGNTTLTTGSATSNTAMGSHSSSNPGPLGSLTTGAANVALGYQSLRSCTTGSNNTAAGVQALFKVTTGTDNIGIGGGTITAGSNYTSSESSNIIIGNAGTAAESNVIRIGTQGTSTGQQNKFFAAGVYNTSVGATSNIVLVDSNGQQGGLAGSASTVLMGGTAPSFTGSPSVSGSVTAGTSITATSGNITATSGDVVITSGNLKLPTTTSSVGQIQVNGTLWGHSYGTNNTFVGSSSGNTSLTTGSAIENCAFGNSVLTAVTTGAHNAGHGYNTLHSLTTGNYNTACGNNSLGVLTTGSQNTTLGREAGVQLVSGSSNILIGYEAGRNYTGSESGNIILGTNATLGESNVIRLGDASTQTTCYIAGAYGNTVTGSTLLMDSTGKIGTVVSSKRYKADIRDIGDDSTDIMSLKPRSFIYKKTGDFSYGLIAEEVDERMPELVIYNDEGKPDAIKYHELPVLLLNEIQKLHKRIETLEAKYGI
jgi:Chaperone of endosialidase